MVLLGVLAEDEPVVVYIDRMEAAHQQKYLALARFQPVTGKP